MLCKSKRKTNAFNRRKEINGTKGIDINKFMLMFHRLMLSGPGAVAEIKGGRMEE